MTYPYEYCKRTIAPGLRGVPSALMEICASDMSKVESMAHGGSSAYLPGDTVHHALAGLVHAP